MALAGILILVFIIVFAMLWNEGLWSNALTLFNLILAALVTMNYFEPLADLMDKKLPTFTYVVDFLAFWGLFALTFGLLRAITDKLSNTKVKFKMPVEQAGRVVSGLVIAWIMVCLVLTSLHVSPLARTAVRGGFQAEPMSNNFLGTAPDRMWLGFVQKRSEGALSNSPSNPFDPGGEFIFKYGSRREMFSKELSTRVKRTP